MAKRQPQQKVNIFLLKETVGAPEDALSETAAVEEWNVIEAFGEGKLYTRAKPPYPTGWSQFVQTMSPNEVGALKSASPSALAILKTGGRFFALSFGHARHILKPDCFERGFGLRAALNLCDPNSLRGADSSEWDASPKHRRVSMTRRSNIRDFDFSHDLELLRGVTGTPKDAAVGTQISGKDSAIVWCPATASQIPSLCATLLSASQQQVDRDEYPMVGNVSLVEDPTRQETLDFLLLEAAREDTYLMLEVAPPDVIDWEHTHGFRIPHRGAQDQPVILDLTIEMVDALKPRDEWSKEWLQSKRVVAVDGNGNDLSQWSLYDCLVVELDHAGKRYSLFQGKWFEIEPDFVKRIEQAIAQIPIHGNHLGRVDADDKEDEFNKRAEQESNGRLLLLDKKTIMHGGGGSRIEVCDLLDQAGRTLYHVKNRFRSSGLSHLFTQAAVSTELLLEDKKFREKVRTAHPPLTALFPEEPPDPAGYTVVLAIMSPRAKPPIEQLPFLSKVRLDSLLRSMTRFRIKGLEIMSVSP